jgi:hypothetical protein
MRFVKRGAILNILLPPQIAHTSAGNSKGMND